jgi:hypothetical protein
MLPTNNHCKMTVSTTQNLDVIASIPPLWRRGKNRNDMGPALWPRLPGVLLRDYSFQRLEAVPYSPEGYQGILRRSEGTTSPNVHKQRRRVSHQPTCRALIKLVERSRHRRDSFVILVACGYSLFQVAQTNTEPMSDYLVASGYNGQNLR